MTGGLILYIIKLEQKLPAVFRGAGARTGSLFLLKKDFVLSAFSECSFYAITVYPSENGSALPSFPGSYPSRLLPNINWLY